MFGWNDRPYTVESKTFIGGDQPAAIYVIGQYEVKLPGATPESAPTLTYSVPSRRRDANPRTAFPNMEVRDGELRLPVEDIVGEILARVEPLDIAIALWGDADVREAFIESMVSRYAQNNIGDIDRRKFLAGVKEAVHSVAVDRLASKMAELEYTISQRFSVYQAVGWINQTLASYGATRPPRDGEDGPQPLRIVDPSGTPEFKIGGTAWNEARSHWREEVLRHFPAPASVDTHPQGGDANAAPFMSGAVGAEGDETPKTPETSNEG